MRQGMWMRPPATTALELPEELSPTADNTPRMKKRGGAGTDAALGYANRDEKRMIETGYRLWGASPGW